MSEALPKLLELKFLKKISKIIILPMIVASSISQFGLEINIWGFTIGINQTSSLFIQTLQFILALSANTFLISMPLWYLHNCLPVIHYFTYSNKLQRSLVSITPILPITFGFLGFFHTSEIQTLSNINFHWYYTAFIFGFYLMSVEDDIDHPMLKNEEDRSYPKRNFPLAFTKDEF